MQTAGLEPVAQSQVTPPVDADSPLPTAPYVGMRPFSRAERAVFFGRGPDAERLSDKIFSSRVTLVYGPSGVGKSSLLSTLVVPRLEEQDARAIYFDAWRGADPIADLVTVLRGEVTRSGETDPGESATLTELVRLLGARLERTIVLVLDQLEELLTSRGLLDPLRRELGALARALTVDARIVLSLREEHLASLEPLRVEIPTLFQSAYRLEPLGEPGCRAAIVEPAGKFGVTFEEPLVSELVGAVRMGRGAHSVDLPMLQLVCDELWTSVHPRRGDVIQMSAYQDLGGKDGILEAYLTRVMPRDVLGRVRTATLMLHLAPPDGHKMSFSASHLAKLTRVRESRVAGELARLSSPDARVLRSRGYGSGERRTVLYELQHDAFVSVVAPWRDRVLWSTRIAKVGAWLATVVATVAVVLLVALWWVDRRQLRLNTTEVFRDPNLNGTPELKLDRVASYLLWTRSGPERLDRLREVLTSREAPRIPDLYGIDASGAEFIALPPPGAEWPFTVEYAPARKLNPFLFEQTWQGLAKMMFIEQWRIPVPLQLKLREDDTFPRSLVRFTGYGIEPLDLELPSHENAAFLTSARLQPEGQEFLHRFERDWIRLPHETGGPWWVVPRWSLPVWKAAGGVAVDGSGLPAFRLAIELQKHPERLLSPSSVEFLLKDAERRHPVTVAEARSVRGERLPRDLAEIVRGERSLERLDLFLDALAVHGDAAFDRAAAEAIGDAASPIAALPERFTGPHRTRSAPVQPAAKPPRTTRLGRAIARLESLTEELRQKRAEREAAAIANAYRDVGRWLPPLSPAVRVSLGSDLARAWLEPGALGPKMERALERARDHVMRRFGVDGFRVEVGDQAELEADAIRIEILGRAKVADASPFAIGRDASIERLVEALSLRVGALRSPLLRAENVKDQLESARPRLRSWLIEHWSITDLKVMERAVLNPDGDEVERNERLMSGARSDAGSGPSGRSIRDPTWLLGSLVFWSRLEACSSPTRVAARLRATQSAVAAPQGDGGQPEVRAAIRKGIAALREDRIAEATRSFDAAIRADRQAAIASFLPAWASVRREDADAAIARACADPRGARLDRSARLVLEDRVADPQFDERTPPEERRRLRTCLLSALPVEYEDERAAVAEALVANHPDPAGWSPDDVAWFAEEELTGKWGRRVMPTGVAFAESAMARLPAASARDFFKSVAIACLSDGPMRRCRERLPSMAEASRDPLVWLLLGLFLRASETEEEVRAGLRLAERGRAARELNARLHDLFDVVRVSALARLPGAGNRDALIHEFRRLEGSEAASAIATFELARLLWLEGNAGEATRVLSAGVTRFERDADLRGLQLRTALETGDAAGVTEVANAALKLVPLVPERQKPDQLFAAAVGLVITRAGPWEKTAREFLRSSHSNVPYVAMMLTSRMGAEGLPEARQVLNASWARARPDTWETRLENGDATAWREMLIGFSMGKLERDRVLGIVEDDARFAQSALRHVPLPRSGLLCEGYFYEALAADAAHDARRTRESLQRVLRTGAQDYYEYSVAKFLLRTRPDLSATNEH